MRIRAARRGHGAVTIEMAFALPIMFLLMIGLIVGGMGIFRYQEVAMLAREGSRYASVRGTDYAKYVTGATAATEADIFENAIKPKIVGLDLNKVTCTVTWNANNTPARMVNSYEDPVGNSVTVTVTYRWFPEWFLIGPINLSSTSTLPMSY